MYLNGQVAWEGKIPYPTLAGAAGTSIRVSAIIGTPFTQNSKPSDAIWRLGPLFLMEDHLHANAVFAMYTLGPAYCYNFQGSLRGYQTNEIVNSTNIKAIQQIQGSFTGIGQLELSTVNLGIPESRVNIALSGANLTRCNTTKLYVYNVADVSSNNPEAFPSDCWFECIGGCSSFSPFPLPMCLRLIGGISVLLALVDFASTTDQLVEALDLLVSNISGNSYNTIEMESRRGYEILCAIIKQKSALVTSRVHQLLLTLAGLARPECVIANANVLRHFYLDFELWKLVDVKLQQQALNDLKPLFCGNPHALFNAQRLRTIRGVKTLLILLRDEIVPLEVLDCNMDLLFCILRVRIYQDDFLAISNFLISTLNTIKGEFRPARASPALPISRSIHIANHLLVHILELLFQTEDKTLLFNLLTPKWLFHFLDNTLPSSIINLALRFLCFMLQNSPRNSFYNKFSQMRGFVVLVSTLNHYFLYPDLYFTLFATALGKPIQELPLVAYEFLDLFAVFKQTDLRVACVEILPVILGMVQHSFDLGPKKTRPIARYEDVSPLTKPVGPANVNIPPLALGSTPGSPFNRARAVSTSSGSSLSARDSSDHTYTTADTTNCLPAWLDVAPLQRHAAQTSSSSGVQVTKELANMQQTLIKFITYLFDNCTAFGEACTNSEVVQSIVAVCFPRKDSDGAASEAKDASTEESLALLFRLLVQIIDENFKTSTKGVTVFANIVESAPATCWDSDEHVSFVTRLTTELLEALESTASRKEFYENEKLSANLAKFCTYAVDKITLGLLAKIDKQALQFLFHLLERLGEGGDITGSGIGMASSSQGSKPASKPDIQTIFKAMNHLIIHMITTGGAKEQLVYTIKRTMNNQKIVMSTVNSDQDFFFTLMCTTSRFLWEDDSELLESTVYLWKLLLLTRSSMIEPIITYKTTKGDVIDLKAGGFDLLLQKDLHKFVQWLRNNQAAVLQMIEDNLRKAASSWEQVETKAKAEQQKHWKEKQQQRLRARNKLLHTIDSATYKILIYVTSSSTTIQSSELEQLQKHRRNYQDTQKFVKSLWETSTQELFRERAIWGTLTPDTLAKWKLDETEGPYRMRKKLERDFLFFERYPYISEEQDANLSKIPPPMSEDSIIWFKLHGGPQAQEQSEKKPLVPAEKVPASNSGLIKPEIVLPDKPDSSQDFSPEASPTPLDSSDPDQGSINTSIDTFTLEEPDETDDFIQPEILPEEEEQKDQQILRLLEADEKIQNMFKCSTVQGMGKRDGLFIFTERFLYVVHGYTLGEAGEVVETAEDRAKARIDQVVKWAKDYILEILPRRYMLQPVAIEIFSDDGQNDLLVFSPQDIAAVIRLCNTITEGSSSVATNVTGARGGDAPQTTSVLKKPLVRMHSQEQQYTQLWVDGKISNFQYLMHLNTLAGRSYNDLTQYPVFPWILADYESEELELDNPATFRDLSKPMGALTEPRASQFRERFDSAFSDDPEEQEKRFHYGSHYSSAAVVVYYMIRMEPFTTSFLELQGGRWDHPDRLFHSVLETWQLNSAGSTSQVMELIPEFFYFPGNFMFACFCNLR